MSPESNYILVTDIGSTTTKALLIGADEGSHHFLGEIEVPTTVEKPNEDVKLGVVSACRALEKTGVNLIGQGGEITAPYLTTSSAGGGLQILVFGLSQAVTGRTAQLTALGAGGVILKTFTIDDDIPVVEKMRLIQELHPDLILMAGGVDGGAIAGVVRLAELLSLAKPTPKFHQSEKIPLVFCGNVEARRFVSNVLEENFEVHVVENIQPTMREENRGPAKEKIHQLFMENVMERAPGYAGLKNWVVDEIIPTPAGVENILRLYAEEFGENVLMVDMGGATTDIFTNIGGEYRRTVAANIGMSYSLSNIVAHVGFENIMAHLPTDFPEADTRNYIANKTLNPTYTPQHDCEIRLEQAAAIEGIGLAWRHHVTTNFKVAQMGFMDQLKMRSQYMPSEQIYYVREDQYFQYSDIDLIIGAGGVISHVARNEEALWVLAEGFKPIGITKVAIDGSFKSPHLGVLSNVDAKLALKLFQDECLEDVGYVVAPIGKIAFEKPALSIFHRETGKTHVLKGGELLLLEDGGTLEVTPIGKVYVCKGMKEVELRTALPVLFDCRGRGDNPCGGAIARPGIFRLSPLSPGFKTNVQDRREETFKVVKGRFRIERRLPYEGDILVSVGDEVDPETVVGENRFGPRRIYIVDINQLVGYKRQLTEGELAEGILTKVGEHVSIGQRIFERRAGPLGIKEYFVSGVRGEVTHIEKGGLVILREIQDYDGRPATIAVAKKLGVKPKHIRGYLKFDVGDFVERGQSLAEQVSQGIFVNSPTSGTVKEIDTVKGTVTVQYDITPIPLKAFVKGTVVSLREKQSVEIECSGYRLYGVIGFGGEHSGVTAMIDEPGKLDGRLKGKIAVLFRPIDETFLRRSAKVGLAGVIAPSIENRDWVNFYGEEIGVALTGDEDIPFTLILTEGFGAMEMNQQFKEFLLKMNGSVASLSGRTQIRAGVTRPMVIVTE